MKNKVANFNLKRKEYHHNDSVHNDAVFDFVFLDSLWTGFCGNLFVEQFPHTSNANIIRLRVSTHRDHRKGERKMTLVNGSRSGVMHNGKFIFLLNDAIQHVTKGFPMIDGQTFYVQAIIVS